MIDIKTIHSTAVTLMEKAAIDIPDDYLQAIRKTTEREEREVKRGDLVAELKALRA